MEQQRDLTEMMREYEERVRQTDRSFYVDATDLLDMMDAYSKAGQTFEAEACLRHALRLHPDNEEVLLMKAYSLKDKGFTDEARAIVDALPDQQTRGVLMFRLEDLLGSLDTAEAERLLGEYWERTPDRDDDFCIEAAELLMDYGLMEKALVWLERVVHKDKHVVELLAECHYQREDYEKATDILNEALDADPYDEITWSQLAEVQCKAGRYAEAVDSCDYALAINPRSEHALRIKASACIDLGRTDEAALYARRYAALKPKDFALNLMLGEAFYSAGRYAEALPLLRRANACCPSTEPDKSRIILVTACAYAGLKNFPMVYETLLQTNPLGSSCTEIHLQTAAVCLEHGDRDYCLSGIMRVLYSLQHTPEQVLRIAVLLHAGGCFSEAEAIWAHISFRCSELPPAIYPYLAYAFRALGEHKAFVFFLERACEQDPTLTRQLFADVFPGKSVGEYMAAARGE